VKALVAGWFSFEGMGATAGDVLARDVACAWLERAGRRYDVAVAPPFTGGVDWRSADPAEYAELVFVCGPIGNGPPLDELLARFAGSRLVGLDLSLLQPLREWDPFDVLVERDSERAARPDISLAAAAPHVPVVGLVLIHPQPEYGPRDRHAEANGALRDLVANREAAVVEIDTRLDANATGLRTAAEVESLIARMDVVLTTRLHGLVLALKNAIPVLAVDPVAGGAKISRQAQALGWPFALGAHELDERRLREAFEHCLTDEARAEAARVGARAKAEVERIGEQFVAALGEGA
jgi:Polysaccharide pyruvyl transferase